MTIPRLAVQWLRLPQDHQVRICLAVGFDCQQGGVLSCISFNNLFYDVNPLPFLIHKKHPVADVCPKHGLGERVFFGNDSGTGIVMVPNDSSYKRTFREGCQVIMNFVSHFDLKFIILCLDDRNTKSLQCELRSGLGRLGGGSDNLAWLYEVGTVKWRSSELVQERNELRSLTPWVPELVR